MKIYTKTGDAGKTSLIGGKRVSKADLRIEAYGTLDELIAWCGLLRDTLTENYYRDFFIKIQDRLMVAASLLAADCEGCEKDLPQLRPDDSKILEKEIDRMEKKLPPLKSFVLPGGHPTVSHCHITRTICRRAERKIISLSENYPVNTDIIIFLNRLSDFLFVFARLLSRDLGAEEIPWKPDL